MKGIDTNIVVRYYVNDDKQQHITAKKFINENEVFLSNLVIAETYWVLVKLYQLNRPDLEAIFTHMKRVSNIHLENDVIFSRAVSDWSEKKCDFSDALIHNIYKENGFVTITFDKTASKKLGMQLLQS